MGWWVWVHRELLTTARRPAAWRWRFFFPALCLGLILPYLIQEGFWKRQPSDQGRGLFFIWAQCVWAACLGAGVLTADCISSERRAQTLGLLFLTDLKPGAVLAGKLFGKSLTAIATLMVVLPLLTLPMLLGGVGLSSWVAWSLSCAQTMFLSLSVGLMFSTLLVQAPSCVLGTLGAMAGLAMGLPVVSSLVQEAGGPEWLARAALSVSPVTGLEISFQSLRSGWLDPWLWWHLGVLHGLSWLALGTAALRLGRIWREGPLARGQDMAGASRIWWQRWRIDRNPVRRRRWLDKAPFVWRVCRYRGSVLEPWLGLVGLGVLSGLGLCLIRKDGSVGVCVFFLMLCVFLKVLVGVRAPHFVFQDRQQGAVELVAVTPLGVTGLWKQHLLALFKIYGFPVLGLMALGLLCWAVLKEVPYVEELASVVLLATIFLPLDTITLGLLGTWLGLACRSELQAILWGLGLVLVLPWFLFWIVVEGLTLGGVVLDGDLIMDLMLVIGLAVDGTAAGWAWKSLTSRAAEAAAS